MVGILQAYGQSTGLFPSVGNGQSLLFDQIRAAASERFTEEKSAIDNKAQATSDAIDAESERYISVKAQINNANIAVESGFESIETIRNYLLDLRTTIALAGESGEDPEFRSSEFDAKLAAINGEADTGGRAFNLVGYINRVDFTPNSIEYRANLGLRVTELQGTYVGHDWRIRAGDGSYWVPDLTADSLTHYSELQGEIQKTTLSDGSEADKTTSLRNAVTLVSYDSTTGAITLDVTFDPELPPEIVSGTLEQEGNGLLGSWFYDKLATSGGRQRAFEAIDKAEIELTARESILRKAEGLVATDSRKIDEELNRLSHDKVVALTKQLDETEKLQVTTAQQILAMQTNLETLSQQQQSYINAFAGYVRSPFLRFSLTA